MNNKSDNSKSVALFESQEIRRTWHSEMWYFVVEDVVLALTESGDPKQYVQRMRERDPELSQGWVQIVHTLDVMTKGGRQKINRANLALKNIFHLMQKGGSIFRSKSGDAQEQRIINTSD